MLTMIAFITMFSVPAASQSVCSIALEYKHATMSASAETMINHRHTRTAIAAVAARTTDKKTREELVEIITEMSDNAERSAKATDETLLLGFALNDACGTD